MTVIILFFMFLKLDKYKLLLYHKYLRYYFLPLISSDILFLDLFYLCNKIFNTLIKIQKLNFMTFYINNIFKTFKTYCKQHIFLHYYFFYI